MTCDELVRVLPELEGGYTIEQQQHLRACPRCAELIADLNAITAQAELLRDTALEDPSPRVWNSLEIALRQEGLIRGPLPAGAPVRLTVSRRRLVWLVPAMATLLIVLGLLVYQKGGVEPQVATAPKRVATTDVATVTTPDSMPPEEQQLLSLVEARTPGMRASFESDLRAVDSYIQDAEQSARNNPNDEIAQQHLMNAYEQRAMVYEMAMDHTVQ
jgi:hypothetical protein